MIVKIINKSYNPIPEYESSGASGMDVRAFLKKEIVLKQKDRVLIPTGLYFEIPEGFEIQVRPRSGLALKNGVTVLNSPGTIDSDYRGELGIILINHSSEDFSIKSGDRIAQIVLSKYEKVSFINANEISKTDRMESGFGSTGVN